MSGQNKSNKNGNRPLNITYVMNKQPRRGKRRDWVPWKEWKKKQRLSVPPVKTVGKKKDKKENKVKVAAVAATSLAKMGPIAATHPVPTSTPVDLVGLLAVIEACWKNYMMDTDIAGNLDTGIWYGYGFLCALVYIREYGGLTGTTNLIPDNCKTSNLLVPVGLAKYLEGMGTYSKGGKTLKKTVQYPPNGGVGDFVFSTVLGYTGINTALVPQRVGLDNQTFLNTITQPQGPCYGATNTNSTYTFASFLTNADQLTACLQQMAGVGSAIYLKDIPGKAWDASAHCVCSTPPITSAIPVGTVTNFVPDFDPELGVMYSLSTATSSLYTSYADKPIPNPVSIIPGSMPYYIQLFNTLAYLGRVTTSKYRPGHPLLTLTLGRATKISSLFRAYHVLNSSSFSAVIMAAYNQNMLGKPADLQTDVNLRNLGNLMAISYHALQRKYNSSDPDHMGVPLCQISVNGVGNIITSLPQLAFVDDAAKDVDLPPLITEYINSLGPVVYGGRLRTPLSDYNPGGTTTMLIGNGIGTSLTIPGPVGWSAGGFQTVVDNYYGVPNIMTNNLFNIATITPDGYQLFYASGNNIYNIDNVWIQTYFGPHGTLHAAFYLQGYMLGGVALTSIIQVYQDWWSQGYPTSVPPTTHQEDDTLGSASLMLANKTPTVIEEPENVSYSDVVAGVISQVPDGPDQIASGLPLSSTDLLMSAMQSTTGEEELHNPISIRLRPITRKLKMQAGIPPSSTDLALNVASAHAADPNYGSTWLGTLTNLTRSLTKPNSLFNDQLTKFQSSFNPDVQGAPVVSALLKKFLTSQAKVNNAGPIHGQLQTAIGMGLDKLPQNLKPLAMQYVGTMGVTTREIENQTPKKGIFGKILNGAKKGAKFAVSAVKTAGEVAKTVETIGALIA